MENKKNTFEDTSIAIIGMSGRFPSSKDLSEFWENISEGRECLSTLTKEELLASGVSENLLNNPDYVRVAGILPDYDQFDESFFGYSPKEALALDPQYRIFLEEAWKALEDAAYNPDTYSGNIGVFAGCKNNASSYLQSYLNSNDSKDLSPFEIGVFSETSQLVTRASYDLNLTGPSVQIQTACSTSLVAIHMACQSLLTGDSDMALAGGITLLMPPKFGYTFEEGLVYSPDGKCRSFDKDAKGTIMSNGIGVIVLKRLSDALYDRDHIRAVIKGSAINNDGKKKISFTAPSVSGQSAAIKSAIHAANINPETVNYIEAHGTATIIGDPIEINALTEAFRASTSKNQFCAIGSVKTNIGHLDVAAGVAGVIKTTLALENKTLPKSLHFESANPHIDFPNTPFYVQNTTSDWSSNNLTPRRAGVSAFGIGGTNAHLILEEAPSAECSDTLNKPKLLCISAKTKTALENNIKNLLRFLEKNQHSNLDDVAYTLQVGRKHFKQRTCIICNNIEEAIAGLKDNKIDELNNPIPLSDLLSLQEELYKNFSIFRESFDDPIFDSPAFTNALAFRTLYAFASFWKSLKLDSKIFFIGETGKYLASFFAGKQSLEQAIKASCELESNPSTPRLEDPKKPMEDIFLKVVAMSYLAGKNLNFSALYNDKNRNRLSLPTYAFDHSKFWPTPSKNTGPIKSSSANQSENPVSTESKTMHSMESIKAGLFEIWKNVFGMNDIQDNDNFFDIGGTSLLALRITNKIHDIFKFKPAITWVYENDDIKKQSAKIASELKKKGELQGKQILSEKELLTFQDSDQGVPLFLVHPSRAGAEVYYRLAKGIEKNIPVFGIESHNLNCPSENFITSIEELARAYVKILKIKRPRGPYILGGWSMGGIIAYEMAQQLVASGDTVLNLYMFDSAVTTQFEDEKYPQIISGMQKMISADIAQDADAKLKIEKIIEIECNMLAHYKNYKTYGGDVILFKANHILNKAAHGNLTKNEAQVLNEMFATLSADSTNGWGGFIPKLKTIALDCCHETILSPEILKIIIPKINEDLQRYLKQ